MRTASVTPRAGRSCYWPRFRLRTLLVVMTLACIGLALFASDIWRARRSRMLADNMRQQGRIPHFILEPRAGDGQPASGVPFREQIAEWLGEPYLAQRVKSMHIAQPGVTDDELAEIAALLPPAVLHLYDNQLTDAGMDHFARMPRLKELWIGRLNISADGLAKLSNLESLEHLVLMDDKVTDATLERIAELKHVRELQLVRTTITEVGLRHVAQMPNLEYLFLSSTPLSDAQVDEIAKMGHLKRLDLCGVGWNDERMKKLAGLKKLTHLMLYNNSVTGDGAMQLAEMEQLQYFNLREKGVSAADKARLKQVLPNCDINP